MKTLIKKNQTLLFILIIAIVFIISVIVFVLTRFSKQPETQPTVIDEKQLTHQNDVTINNSIIAITKTYITQHYPDASDIFVQSEYVGGNFVIENVTFTLKEREMKRKVYLQYFQPDWIAFYDSEDTITCDKVRELINTDTILT